MINDKAKAQDWQHQYGGTYVTAVTFGVGETAVFYSIVCADIVMTGMGYYYFKLGRWKLTEV
ncbi:MAG: hypothetical protein IH892_23195 [Planctomycetes bacterium]|nr:hypothetical protein [Planctomycetota bacterium]